MDDAKVRVFFGDVKKVKIFGWLEKNAYLCINTKTGTLVYLKW